MVRCLGVEPSYPKVTDLQSAAVANAARNTLILTIPHFFNLVRVAGFEPAATRFQGEVSTGLTYTLF